MAGHWPGVVPELGGFPGGATARLGGRGWVLAGEPHERALGGALAWARQQGVSELHMLADAGAGVLARRATLFSNSPLVWRVTGRILEPARPVAVTPEAELSADVAAFAPLIEAAGADPVVEHGVLRAEVLGLEVARVVADDEGTRLEVGVGAFDREAHRMVHGDKPTAQALAAAVEAVREVRRPDVPVHQINQLAGERWMRAILVRRPDLVGAASLRPLPSPVLRTDLRQLAPAPAAGTDVEGHPLVVVCSSGIDIDLVPAAADARLTDGRDARLVMVVPEGDDHPVTRALAAALIAPAEVHVLSGDWRNL